MKYLIVLASTILAVTASDFGNWSLYCGSSCSGGTLISTGSLETNVISSCTSLGATYEYCYLEVEEYPNLYRASMHSDCGDTETLLSNGDCTPDGNWKNYQMYYYA